jgi:arylsulfatase A-like enzyme
VLDTVRLQSTTLGDSDLGTTRFLERFAEGSVTYRQARSSSPWTLPSHASLFTGLYATEHRVSAIAPYLPPHLPTLAERLGAAGYRTVAVSANAWVGPDFGLQRGFERYVRGWQLIDSETDFTGPDRLTAVDRAERFRTALRAAPTTSWPRLFANALYAMYRSRGHFHGSRIARLTVRELEEAATDDRPLFLFVNFLDAHMPYRPPGRHRECFGVSRRDAVRVRQEPTKYMVGCLDLTDRDLDVLGSLYHAEISRLDEIMARFLPRLEVLLGPDAMVVVTSDHGENVGEHGLLDHQFSLHDTVLRVPLLVRYPGGEAAGERRDELVQWQDLFATTLLLAGVDEPATPSSRLLPGPPGGPPRDFLLAEYPVLHPTPEMLLKRYPGADISRIDRTLTAVVDTGLNKAISASDGTVEVYETASDPWETRPLADARLLGRLEALRARASRQLRIDESAREDREIEAGIRKQLEAIGYL